MSVLFNYEKFSDIKKLNSQKILEKQLQLKLLESSQEKIKNINLFLEDAKKARVVIQTVANLTQRNLTKRIESLVSTAIMSVDKLWPEFIMKIVSRRNQSEVDFFFMEDGQEQEPLDSCGYGLVDIAADSLNTSIWSLNKNRPTFIKDEPFKNLSKDHHVAASKMMKMLCDNLGIQIIMVSHEEELSSACDRVFVVKKKGKISKITQEVNNEI